MFVERPPENHASLPAFSCTESKVAPTLDWIGAGLQMVGLIMMAGDETVEYGAGAYAVNLGFTGLLVAGGVSGNKKVGQCRAAKLELGERYRNREAKSAQSAEVAPALSPTGGGPVSYARPGATR
jgi:hypothetical protein